MTPEDKLKELILSKYKSIREFSQTENIAYSTISNMLKRGLSNSSVINVISVFKPLNITIDELYPEIHQNENINIETNLVTVMNFQKKLKQLLEHNQMTQSDLCKKTGISTSLMANYYNGKKNPSLTNAILIAEVFNITLDELVDRKNIESELTIPQSNTDICTHKIRDKTFDDIMDYDIYNKKTKKNHPRNVGEEIYNKLVEVGFIKHGEQITDKHLEVLADVLAPQVEFARFKIDKHK